MNFVGCPHCGYMGTTGDFVVGCPRCGRLLDAPQEPECQHTDTVPLGTVVGTRTLACWCLRCQGILLIT